MSLNGRKSTSLEPLHAEVVTHEVLARPGEVVSARFRVRNDGVAAIGLLVRVHGLGHSSSWAPVSGVPLPGGGATEIEVPLEVPETFGVGAHALAVEFGSGRAGEQSALARVVLTIGAPTGIATRVTPSVMRGRRRARFEVEVDNRTSRPARVELHGSGPDLRVRIEPAQVQIAPGATATARGKVRGPRRWVGDPVQHVLTVETRADSIPEYATASFRQKALVSRRARGGVIGVAFLAVWALLAAAVVLVWTRRDDGDDATEQVVDGSSLPPLTNPDGSPATGPGAGGGSGGGSGGSGGGAGGAGDAADGTAAPTDTILRGTVKAGASGDDAGVLVTLTPTIPGEASQSATTGSGSTPPDTAGGASALVAGGPGAAVHVAAAAQVPAAPAPAQVVGDANAEPTKFWPARYGTYQPQQLTNLRTLSVEAPSAVSSDDDGTWQFQQVPLRHSYEVSFAKPGYTTQSFLVTPPDDGEPVELEVELQPGDGALSGRVLGTSDAAQVTITDGTLTFGTTTSTGENPGEWSVDRLSTPGTYTVTVEAHGYGTEVMQVHLDPGQRREGLNVQLVPNVGSIAGTITAGGSVLGGVTVSAAAGDQSIATTSLTEGATGTYNFPQLAIGSTYTLTVAADGYITQTRSVTVSGNVTGIDFGLVKSTASIVGRITSVRDGTVTPLVSAAVTVSAGELEVHTSSAAAPDAGAFSVTDLPPGTYVLAASRYDHPEVSQLVTLAAGQVFDAGDIALDYVAPTQVTATGSLLVRTVDAFGADLPGATVQLIDVGGTLPTQTKQMAATEASVSFTAVPIGTYRLRVTKNDYRPATVNQVSIGLGPAERQVTLLQYGTARGTVMDVVAGLGSPQPLEDDQGNPVYQTPSGEKVYFDPAVPIAVDVSQTGPGSVAGYIDTTGHLVVEYTDGSHYRDSDGDGSPDQLLTPVNEQVPAEPPGPLGNYELLLYRIDSGNHVCIAPLPTSGDEWEIDPTMQLLSGSYALRFGPLDGEVGTACAGRGRTPEGFAPITSTAAGDVATFEIADDLDQKVVLDPIPVAPYPGVSGRILVPTGVTGGLVQFDDFDTATDGGVTVQLSCNGQTANASAAPGGGGTVTFSFTRADAQALFAGAAYDTTTGALPACTLHAAAASADFIAVDTPLTLSVALAAPYTDRALSIGLVDDPSVITGTVQWRDLGANTSLGESPTQPVPSAGVTSRTEVIVGVDSADAPNPDPGNAPVTAPDPTGTTAAAGSIATTADPAGAFAFAADQPRQVLGSAEYDVTGTPFAAGAIGVEASPGDWTASAAAPSIAADVVDGGSSVDVFLAPDDGSISGTVQVTSIWPSDFVERVAIGVTPPGQAAVAPMDLAARQADTSDSHTGGWSGLSGIWGESPAPAGTWRLDYSVPPGSGLYLTSPPSQRLFVPAGAAATANQVSAVALGSVAVNLTDGASAITTAGTSVSITQQAGAPATVPAGTFSQPDGTPDTNGSMVFADLPVSAADPVNQGVTYLLTATVPLHDEATSTVTVTRLTPNGDVVSTVSLAAGDLSALPVTVYAGERLRVDMTVPAYGSVSGTVQGYTEPPSFSPRAVEPLPAATGATVVLTRADGPFAGTTYPITDVAADGTFSTDVPAGTYSVTFSATNHVPVTLPANISVASNGTTPGVDATLELQLATYSVTALVSTLVGAAGVEGATVELYWDPGHTYVPLTGTDSALYSGFTGGSGTATFSASGGSGIYPGEYTLVVRKIVSGSDTNFPVIADISIPGGAYATGGSTTAHTIVMAPVGGSITGSVTAESSANRPVALPAGISVSRSHALGSYGSPDVTNDATEDDLANPPAASLPLAEATAGEGTSYTFDGLFFGTHTLTFGDASPAYAVSPADPLAVTVTGAETGADAVYTAADVDLVFDLVDDASGDPIADPDAAVTLQVGEAGQAVPGTGAATWNATDETYELADVPPDLVAYLVDASAEGYLPVDDQPVTVTPSGTAQHVEVRLVPLATITGTAKLQSTPSGTPVAGGTVTLKGSDASSVTVPTNAAGGFTAHVVVPEGGTTTYTVEVSQTGYKTRVQPVNGGNALTLGTTYALGELVAKKWASLDLAVTTPATGTSLTISPSAVHTGSGTSASHYTATQLDPDTSYTITITHADYQDEVVVSGQVLGAGGSITSTSIAMDPKPARATITVTDGGSITGLALAVDPDDGVSVSGPTAGVFTVTNLEVGEDYDFEVSAPNYDSASAGSYTAIANGHYAPGAVTLVPHPATATITVSNHASLTGLSLAVDPDDGVSVSGPTAGVFTVTGLEVGEEYEFVVSATNHDSATLGPYTATPGGSYAPPAVALTPKPATVTVTVTIDGGTADDGDVLVVSDPAVTPAHTAGTFVWTFPVTGGFGSFTFSASATDYEGDSDTVNVTPNASVPVALTLTYDPPPPPTTPSTSSSSTAPP